MGSCPPGSGTAPAGTAAAAPGQCRTPPPASLPRGIFHPENPRGRQRGAPTRLPTVSPCSLPRPRRAAATPRRGLHGGARRFPALRLTWHGGSRRRAEALPGRCQWGAERGTGPPSQVPPRPRALRRCLYGLRDGPRCQSAAPGRAPGSPLRGGDISPPPPPTHREAPARLPAKPSRAQALPCTAPRRSHRPPRAVLEAGWAAGASPRERRGAERRGEASECVS